MRGEASLRKAFDENENDGRIANDDKVPRRILGTRMRGEGFW